MVNIIVCLRFLWQWLKIYFIFSTQVCLSTFVFYSYIWCVGPQKYFSCVSVLCLHSLFHTHTKPDYGAKKHCSHTNSGLKFESLLLYCLPISVMQDPGGAAGTQGGWCEDPALLPVPEGGAGGAGRGQLPGQLPWVPHRYPQPLPSAYRQRLPESLLTNGRRFPLCFLRLRQHASANVLDSVTCRKLMISSWSVRLKPVIEGLKYMCESVKECLVFQYRLATVWSEVPCSIYLDDFKWKCEMRCSRLE